MSCRGEEACVTNETMSHAFQGHSRWLGHRGEFWQNVVLLEEETANHFSICAWKIPLMVWKGKRYYIGRWPPRSRDLQYATEEEQRAINNSLRKNKAAGSKWKWCSAVDVSSVESSLMK